MMPLVTTRQDAVHANRVGKDYTVTKHVCLDILELNARVLASARKETHVTMSPESVDVDLATPLPLVQNDVPVGHLVLSVRMSVGVL